MVRCRVGALLTAISTLAALVAVCAATTSPTGPDSAVKPRRIPFGDQYYAEPAGLYNPAAVLHSTLGWVIVFRYDECFYEKCGIHGTKTALLVSDMGLQPQPDMTRLSKAAASWSYDKASFGKLLEDNASDKFALGDFRPFLVGQDVYVSFWIKFGWPKTQEKPDPMHVCWSIGWGTPHSCEYTAYGRLDFATKSLQLVQQFSQPIFGTQHKPEKNWAFFEQDGQLMLMYSLLPCTVVYTVDQAAPKGAVFNRSYCYNQPELWEKETNHILPTSRLSGHPQPWKHANGTTDLLMMVHSRVTHHSYHNWALRVDPVSLRITHISAGPVIKSTDYKVQGYLHGVLVVSSFHVITVDGVEVLRMFMGEGDHYSDWEDVAIEQIDWWAVDPALAQSMPDEQAALAWGRRRSQTRRSLLQ